MNALVSSAIGSAPRLNRTASELLRIYRSLSREGRAYASEAALARMLKRSERTVQRHVRELKAAGAIDVERPTRTSTNRVLVLVDEPARVGSNVGSQAPKCRVASAKMSGRHKETIGVTRITTTTAPRASAAIAASPADVLLLREKENEREGVEQPFPLLEAELARVASVRRDVAPPTDPEPVVERQHVHEPRLPGDVDKQLQQDYVERLKREGVFPATAVAIVRKRADRGDLGRVERDLVAFPYRVAEAEKRKGVDNRAGYLITSLEAEPEWSPPPKLLLREQQRANDARERVRNEREAEQTAREAQTRATAQKRLDSMPPAELAALEARAIAEPDLACVLRMLPGNSPSREQMIRARMQAFVRAGAA